MPDRVADFDDAVLAVLACPVCDDRPKLMADETGEAFECPSCNRRFPIKNGIPQLVAEDAVTDEEGSAD